jgi:hypothetical protein
LRIYGLRFSEALPLPLFAATLLLVLELIHSSGIEYTCRIERLL